MKISCSDQLLDDIAEKCSFTRLKEADDTIKDKTLYKEIVLGANPMYQGDITKVNPKSFFREGEFSSALTLVMFDLDLLQQASIALQVKSGTGRNISLCHSVSVSMLSTPLKCTTVESRWCSNDNYRISLF